MVQGAQIHRPRQPGLEEPVPRSQHRAEPVDDEARKLRLAFKTMMLQPKLPVRQRFDARLIERWLLKTTINIALQQPTRGWSPLLTWLAARRPSPIWSIPMTVECARSRGLE